MKESVETREIASLIVGFKEEIWMTTAALIGLYCSLA
eukprot:COSAG05_NODE_129_length_17200_cov_47.810128_11_plen_37_part_00